MNLAAPLARADLDRFATASRTAYKEAPPAPPMLVVSPCVYDYMKRTGKSVGEIVAEALSLADGEQ